MWKGFNKLGVSGICLILGFFLSLYGGITALLFLQEVDRGGRIPPGQIARQLILPHIALLAGMGIMLGAIIFIVRRKIILKRLEDPEI